MRVAIILGAMVAGLAAPAAAQSWQEYAYPDYGFAVSFPAAPNLATVPYRDESGVTREAHLYSLTEAGNLYRVTVIDFSNSAMGQGDPVAQAVDRMRQSGTVRVDLPARINRIYGRQLSIDGRDGSHSVAAIFFDNQKLYQVEGITLPTNPDLQSGNAMRFQQSLRFTRGNYGRGFR